VNRLAPYRIGRSQEPPPGQAMMSRWAHDKDLSYEKLRPELVCEVAFDQVTGHRIRHGSRFVRWRPDKPARQCTVDQLMQEANVDLREMLEELGRAPPAFGREGDDVVEMRGGVTQAEGGEGVNQVAHWTAPRRVAGSATRRRRLTDAA